MNFTQTWLGNVGLRLGLYGENFYALEGQEAVK